MTKSDQKWSARFKGIKLENDKNNNLTLKNKWNSTLDTAKGKSEKEKSKLEVIILNMAQTDKKMDNMKGG